MVNEPLSFLRRHFLVLDGCIDFFFLGRRMVPAFSLALTTMLSEFSHCEFHFKQQPKWLCVCVMRECWKLKWLCECSRATSHFVVWMQVCGYKILSPKSVHLIVLLLLSFCKTDSKTCGLVDLSHKRELGDYT